MEDPYNCSRPYIPTQPYSPVDPLGNAHYDHIKDGAPANPELGYDQPPLIVTANESVDLFQDPHGWSQRACTTPVPHPEATYRPPRDSLHEPLPSIDQAKPDPLDHAQFALNPSSSCDRAVEGYIHNPMRTDCAENRSDDERQLSLNLLHYLQKITVKDPQIMRRFVLACMESNITEKDLLWMYHMQDYPQNGTLPMDPFIAITKQHLKENTQLTIDQDYKSLAKSYLGFGGDFVRYVDLCNDLHGWRVLNHDYKEFPLRQIYPPYRHPLHEHYPRPPQGDWHLDTPRRESHQLPTMTLEELTTVPQLMRAIGEALYHHHHRFNVLEHKFQDLEKLKDNKTVECGLIPHAYVRQVLKDTIPLDLGENELQSLCLYYEHPYILHFFRYRDFLQDAQFEMTQLNSKLSEPLHITRKTKLVTYLKRYIHSQGLNFVEPFKDFDTFGQGHLNRSHMKRALHVLRIGPGQRCDMSERDINFLLDEFCDNGEAINYKKLNGQLMQVFPERFEPGGRLAMVMESFEPNLARGPYYAPRASLMSKQDILNKSFTDEEVLGRAIDRLKMLVVERRIHLEPVFRVFDPHNIRYVENVLTFARIMQLAGLPVTPEEVDVLIEKFADKKGFRYQEFLQAIDTQSYPFRLPTYPLTLATMEQWKNRRAWFPEVTPQNVYQSYQGPEAIVEKCRRKVSVDRLHVLDFFKDYDTHNRGAVTRKQFRRATAAMGIKLSPMENLILENRYAYGRDISCLDYDKFVTDMDLVYAPKDVSSHPADIPEHYHFKKVMDREPIKPVEIALAQEGFRKLCEKMLELRIHIEPYFADFDPWHRGGITQERFRRIMSALSLDLLTEVEWKALFKYFARPSQHYFDYRAFLDKVAGVEKKRERNVGDDPRYGLVGH